MAKRIARTILSTPAYRFIETAHYLYPYEHVAGVVPRLA
jgi:hypothetical protein